MGRDLRIDSKEETKILSGYNLVKIVGTVDVSVVVELGKM